MARLPARRASGAPHVRLAAVMVLLRRLGDQRAQVPTHARNVAPATDMATTPPLRSREPDVSGDQTSEGVDLVPIIHPNAIDDLEVEVLAAYSHTLATR